MLGYSPLQVGLAFVPTNVIMAAFSLGISARLVMRFGIKPPLAAGLVCAAVGLLLFAGAPVDGSFLVDVMPPMLLLGIGAGIAFSPVLIAAMNDVAPNQSGLASGIVNTSFMMGGALGLALLASMAAARSDRLLTGGGEHLAAINSGYHLAFLGGAAFATLAAVVGVLFMRKDDRTVREEIQPAWRPGSGCVRSREIVFGNEQCREAVLRVHEKTSR